MHNFPIGHQIPGRFNAAKITSPAEFSPDSDFNHDPHREINAYSDPAVEFTADELIELALLRSLEIDKLVEATLIDPSSRFDETLLEKIELSYHEIKISIYSGPAYPARQLEIAYENVSLPRLVMDGLRIDCRKVVEEGEKKNNIEAWEMRNTDDVFDYHMTALQVATLSGNHITRYREQLRRGLSITSSVRSKGTSDVLPVTQSHGSLKNSIVPDWGMDLSTITADIRASKVLEMLPDGICSMIPEEFRVLHVESVIRADLYSNFLSRQMAIFENLKTLSLSALRKCIPANQRFGQATADSMARYLVTPKMTFHGTSNQFVPSIVRHGFLAPGAKHPDTHEILPVRCGSTYGQGIYSSPSPAFSLSYSGSEAQPTKPDGFWGLKLFVCATIMGRATQMTHDDHWWLKREPMAGADSHVGNYQMEYIVFDNSQILPCYVIHLDWGAENAKFFQSISADKANFVATQKVHAKLLSVAVAPGDRQRQKEALIAKASKYFPYGYGPASGTSFVIEDVGEVDEDEEDYGDYQMLRVDETYEINDFWDWEESVPVPVGETELGGSNLDEYTSFRSRY